MIRVFTDDRCLEHDVPPGMPEVPERLRGILERLGARGVDVERVGGDRDVREAIIAVHHPDYVARLKRAVERGDGLIDSADTPLSAGTLVAARAAVGTILDAVDWLVGRGAERPAREPRRAFAAVRPPGHHAEHTMAMGFCYFNHVAIAAEHLVRAHGVERVAIVDFDVHHGNGTQHLFDARPDVFFASLHQHPFYPGTGLASEVGTGPGRGTTLNVPLPAASSDDDYERALLDDVLPAVRDFAPGALLVSAGFDAWAGDPLGGMRITEAAFRNWGRWLAELADEVCAGRILSTLEGGYDLQALPDLVLAYLDGLAATSH